MSADLPERLAELLTGTKGLTRKPMFGSQAFLIRGNLAFGARPDRLMVRIDPNRHDREVARKGCTTVNMRGRDYRGWIWIEAEALKPARELRRWVDLGLAYNATLPAKKKA